MVDLAPLSYEEMVAICKRFVVEGGNGDYLENDGYELAREVERITMQRRTVETKVDPQWTCKCLVVNTADTCEECGRKRPAETKGDGNG